MNSSDQRKAGIIIAVLLIAGVGIYFTQQISEKKDQEGKSALYAVEQSYDEELKALPEADRTLGATIDVDAKFPKTTAGFNDMLNAKKAPSRVLFEAGVKLGTLYLDHNQADKALAVFKRLTSETSSTLQKGSLFYLMGTAEERANQFKDASESYQNGLATNVDGLKGELMLGVVRTSLKLNDKEKAKLYLEKMNKELAGTRQAQIAADLVKGAQS